MLSAQQQATLRGASCDIAFDNLTRQLFATDASNASRTQLFNIGRREWDPELLEVFGVPREALAEVQPSNARFGLTRRIGRLPAGIPVAACGELAGDPAGALVLVGLGVDELSADAGSLDGIRAALAGVTYAELRELAAAALAATDAETVRALAAVLTAREAAARE